MKVNPIILIVDDQLQNLELLEAYLGPHGYEVIKATNGDEALALGEFPIKKSSPPL